MKLASPPKGVTARGVCVSLTLAFPKSGVTTGCIVLFLSDVVVLGSNPFCVSVLEQNDFFLTQLFGINNHIAAGAGTVCDSSGNDRPISGENIIDLRLG
jgi:hypothetical protein